MNTNGLFFNTEDFEITKNKLSTGSFGKVFEIIKISNNQSYAVKILDISHGFNGKDQNDFFIESLILFHLHHPSIVKFHGINFQAYPDPESINKSPRPAIITEYMKNGSMRKLFNTISMNNIVPKWNSTKKIISLLGITNAMSYLHKNGILHCDLNPNNILFDENYYPYISDFGLSKWFKASLTSSKEFKVSNLLGTPLYMAPEIFIPSSSVSASFSVDVFSFAIIAYEIISGLEPYDEKYKTTVFVLYKAVADKVRPNLEIDNIFTEKMKILLNDCWSSNPHDRPTFSTIFQQLRNNYQEYISEHVDSDEIENYISDYCKNADLLENIKNQNQIDQLVKGKNDIIEDMNNLTIKYSKLEMEHEIKTKTTSDYQSALVTLFGGSEVHKPKKAILNLIKASNNGNSEASFLLGLLYERGEYCKQDYVLSRKYFEQAGEQGNSKGFQRIGYFYITGIGFKRSDYAKAKEYFEKPQN